MAANNAKEDTKVTKPKSAAAKKAEPAAKEPVAKKERASHEKLTDAVVRKLIGHTNVVYYNCEIDAWNKSQYNGYWIIGLKAAADRVKKFESVMKKKSGFSAHYEMAAPVTMTIDSEFYNDLGKPISNPPYSRKGTAVVGNIIVKSKATGKYELYCKSWVGVLDYGDPRDASCCGVFKFANGCVKDSAFRAALIAARAR